MMMVSVLYKLAASQALFRPTHVLLVCRECVTVASLVPKVKAVGDLKHDTIYIIHIL